MTITEFLLARIAEDERALWCGRHDHDSSASASYPDCWMPEADCDSRDKREVAAKRRIMEEHRPVEPSFPCATLRALASVYADHPDYDDAWRPA